MNESTYLQLNGWVKSQSTHGITGPRFYKRFSTPTRCRCNHDKEGIQVSVGLSNYPECCTYEIELNGELPDGTWVNLHNHGMPDNLEAGLATIPRLLATWEFIATHNQPIIPQAKEVELLLQSLAALQNAIGCGCGGDYGICDQCREADSKADELIKALKTNQPKP